MSIEPFGSQSSSSDVPVQKLFGATVAKFNASTDFASQPGTCTITLVEDEVDGDRFSPPVVGAPVFFKIVDSVGATIFQYNGLLDTITRISQDGVKNYKVTLISPLRILESVTLILDGYAGYGRAIEGLPRYFSEDGYYQISESDKQLGYLPDGVSMTPVKDYFLTSEISFATNNENLNYTGMWERVYNILNIFGAYENESINNGEAIGLTPYNGFGASSVVKGMRVDKIAYAIDKLVNTTHSSSARRYLGGNMIFGSNTYNVCGTANGYVAPFPYYYGIDIIRFIREVLYYLPEDFVIDTRSITLSEFIGTICDAANADFFVELHNSAYEGDILGDQITQTYPNTLYGGVVSVTLVPKNVYVSCNKPFNEFTTTLLNLELPDMGSYGTNAEINPGTFSTDIFGNIGPLDDNYTSRGGRSSQPYGGKFPVETPSDSNGILTEVLNRAENINVSLKSTHGTTGKMVVGGFQSRMNVVPRDFIYQYWGDITVVNASGDPCGVTGTSTKSIPVLTQILPPNDIWDWIAIDMQDLFGNITLNGVIYQGIYFASVMEIRSALCGQDAWDVFVEKFKQLKIESLRKGLESFLSDEDNVVENKLHEMAEAIGFPSPRKWWGEGTRLKFTVREIREAIYEKVHNIASTHYGKTWAAPVPIMQTKKTIDKESLVGNFTRSWDLSTSAYVEPYLFGTINAPRDSSFIEGGRLKTFVNFEHSFTAQSGDIGYDLTTDSLTGFISGVKYSYDFSEYDPNSIVYDYDPGATGDCGLVGMAHVSPDNISSDYFWIPPAYFTYYNRGHCPFTDTITSSGAGDDFLGRYYTYTYDYTSKNFDGLDNASGIKLLESMVNDPNKKTFFSGAQAGPLLTYNGHAVSNSPPSVFIPCASFFEDNSCSVSTALYPWHVNYDSSTATTFAFRYTGNAFDEIIDKLYETAAQDYGNGVPFVKFSTRYVGYPLTIDQNNVNSLSSRYLDQMKQDLNRDLIKMFDQDIVNLVDTKTSWGELCSVAPAAPPYSIGIPQQSNRYVYGPWVSNFTEIIYAGKFEYEQNEQLVPENYLIPVYGTTPISWQVINKDGEVVRVVENIKGTSLSGFAGMNLAGQAIANSIDDFSLFAQEQGSVTIPGLPLITKLGLYLLSEGPRITDISIDFDNTQVKTIYNFRSLSPRLGKENRELVRRLRRISNAVNASTGT